MLRRAEERASDAADEAKEHMERATAPKQRRDEGGAKGGMGMGHGGRHEGVLLAPDGAAAK